MGIGNWLTGELTSYGPAAWVVWILVTVVATRVGRWRGVIVGQVLIALSVVVLDLMWIRGEMDQPGWNGAPDLDGIFAIGVLIRAFLINATLLPIGLVSALVFQPSTHPLNGEITEVQ